MCEGRIQGFFSFAALVAGGTIGAGLGLLGGTLLVGHWMDGDGAWWSMLAGVAVGVTLGVVASAFIRSEYAGWGVLVSAGGAPLFGGHGRCAQRHLELSAPARRGGGSARFTRVRSGASASLRARRPAPGPWPFGPATRAPG